MKTFLFVILKKFVVIGAVNEEQEQRFRFNVPEPIKELKRTIEGDVVEKILKDADSATEGVQGTLEGARSTFCLVQICTYEKFLTDGSYRFTTETSHNRACKIFSAINYLFWLGKQGKTTVELNYGFICYATNNRFSKTQNTQNCSLE